MTPGRGLLGMGKRRYENLLPSVSTTPSTG